MHAKFLHIIFLINYCCIIIWCMNALEYIGIQYFYVYSHKYHNYDQIFHILNVKDFKTDDEFVFSSLQISQGKKL